MRHKNGPEKKGPEDYRRLAEKCRETAHTISTGRERAELLSMAKIWDFLADHCPHHPALNERVSSLALDTKINLIDHILPWVVLLLGLLLPSLALWLLG
jgi:hypothetical protein